MARKETVSNPEPEQADGPSRETWGNQFQFMLYCLGYAVGYGNLWRFPYLCYKNGGAAFLIPYFIMLLCAGLPTFFLELAIGQYVNLSPATVFPKMAPIMSGIGWGMIVISALTATYFNVIIAWSFFYVFASFSSTLPWSNCDNDFNSVGCFTEQAAAICTNQSLHYYNKTCLSTLEYCGLAHLVSYNQTHCYNPSEPNNIKAVEDAVRRIYASEDFFKNRMLGVTGRTWEDMGAMRWELVGWLALSCVIVGACLAKGIRTTGKIVYFTALFPYVILLILLIRGVTLDGAYEGIEFYLLKPNMTRLGEVEVWVDAAVQIFFSLGICFGCLITLASYNKFNNNCLRDAVSISICNCLTSVIIGVVIFSVLGFLARKLGVEVDDVAASGSGLAFVVYPAAISLMPLPHLWSVLFFLMLISLGLSSQFTQVETVITAVVDQFEWMRKKRSLVVVICCFLFFLAGLPMCLEGGMYMFELFFFYSASVSIITLCIVQQCSVHYTYGFKKMMSNIEEMGIRLRGPLYWYFSLAWLLLIPVVLSFLFIWSIYSFVPAQWGDYLFPKNIQILGWFLSTSSIACIPLAALCVIFTNKKGFKSLFESSPDFCPSSVRHLRMQTARQRVYVSKFRYVNDNDSFCDTEVRPEQENGSEDVTTNHGS
ncbi:sodium- and chloride-dependent betaine transporter-like [Panulirus ornatus]|uniref:sodium- and chloride-dependent betaine transporter-like n=1 Tax=Panulirus ornatus TaxID=150431 RepID=UPI003A87EDFA